MNFRRVIVLDLALWVGEASDANRMNQLSDTWSHCDFGGRLSVAYFKRMHRKHSLVIRCRLPPVEEPIGFFGKIRQE